MYNFYELIKTHDVGTYNFTELLPVTKQMPLDKTNISRLNRHYIIDVMMI